MPTASIAPWWRSLTQLQGTTLQPEGIQMGVGKGQTGSKGVSGQDLWGPGAVRLELGLPEGGPGDGSRKEDISGSGNRPQ